MQKKRVEKPLFYNLIIFVSYLITLIKSIYSIINKKSYI